MVIDMDMITSMPMGMEEREIKRRKKRMFSRETDKDTLFRVYPLNRKMKTE